MARAATGDWDATIMTRAAFERMPVAASTQSAYVEREIAQFGAMLEQTEGSTTTTVKRMEKLVNAAEERLEELLDVTQDPGITFEETGIDYLIVDEVPDYKNLRTSSNIPDASITPGSGQATDLPHEARTPA